MGWLDSTSRHVLAFICCYYCSTRSAIESKTMHRINGSEMRQHPHFGSMKLCYSIHTLKLEGIDQIPQQNPG